MRLLILILLAPFFLIFGAEGLEYKVIELAGYPPAHVIEIDPAFYEIKPVKACDDGIGRESVESLSLRHGAAAAINGGFFSIGGTFDGRASGALKIHDWIGLPVKPRGSVGWTADEQIPKMDRLWVKIEASYGGKNLSVNGINRPRKEGEMILFSPAFHRTTLTQPDGQELIMIGGVVQSIHQGGSAKIPENGFVVSIHKKHPLFNSFEIGKEFTFSIQVIPLLETSALENWQSLDYILGGTPLLLKNGIKMTDFVPEQTLEKFLTERHARTAVGVLPNGHWLFVVIDKTGLFDGLKMDELANLMEKLGCVDALNLDGGGSSTMVFENVVKNFPRGDEDEGLGEAKVRRVSDAIVAIPKIIF